MVVLWFIVFERSLFDFICILGFFLGGVPLLVFEIMKTNTPEFTVKFDQKLGGKDRTEDNLTDLIHFGYNLTLYFDGFDFRRDLGLRS